MSKLTVGPLLFNWSADKRRDFYFRLADEADVDVVYLGEVICPKRESLHQAVLADVVERLERAKKEIVFSTLSLVMTNKQVDAVRAMTATGHLVEVNDVACVQAMEGKPFVVGSFVNVFNEGAMDFLIRKGARRFALPIEMSASAQVVMAAHAKKADLESFVFGRQPLSISMRCYHARAHDRRKDACRLVCANDPEGLSVDTIAGQPLYKVNGTSVMSRGYAVLLDELAMLKKGGVNHFRLSPQDVDMVKVAQLYRAALNKKMSAEDALVTLRALIDIDTPFINGFARGRAGIGWG